MAEDDPKPTIRKPPRGIVMMAGTYNPVSVLGAAAVLAGAAMQPSAPLPIKDAVTVKPTYEAERGRAWLVDKHTLRKTLGIDPEQDGTVEMWIIEAPWAHLGWHSYIVILADLVQRPGDQPINFYLEGATHELLVFALNPDRPRQPVIQGQHKPSMLSPANFGAQLIYPSDDDAVMDVAKAVVDVVNGRLSPDTDFVSSWVARFNDSMVSK